MLSGIYSVLMQQIWYGLYARWIGIGTTAASTASWLKGSYGKKVGITNLIMISYIFIVAALAWKIKFFI